MVRSLLAKLALFAFALFLTSLFLEVGLRIAFYRSKDFSMEMWKYAVQLKRPVPDSNLSFAHAPNSQAFLMGVDVKINSHGLRDYEYPLTKPPGTYRIIMLGDSTTFGWGVRLEDTAAKILERKLNEARSAGYKRFEVINAGVGNYDTVAGSNVLRNTRTSFSSGPRHPGFLYQRSRAGTDRKEGLSDRSVLPHSFLGKQI